MAAAHRPTVLFLMLLAGGCARPGGDAPASAPDPAANRDGSPTATVTLESRSGSRVTGTLQLVDTAAGLHIRGEVRGLTPGAEHGFHIHETGDCSAADASGAGGHFDPAGAPHGRAGAGAHHAGDMPNVVADTNGVAQVDQVLQGVTLAAGEYGAGGRALVVHRDADDYSTQPDGNAGPRVACGVIPGG